MHYFSNWIQKIYIKKGKEFEAYIFGVIVNAIWNVGDQVFQIHSKALEFKRLGII